MNKYQIVGEGMNVTVEAYNLETAIGNLGYVVDDIIRGTQHYVVRCIGTQIVSGGVTFTKYPYFSCKWLNKK